MRSFMGKQVVAVATLVFLGACSAHYKQKLREDDSGKGAENPIDGETSKKIDSYWHFNQTVTQTQRVGDTLYVAGTFDSVGPYTGGAVLISDYAAAPTLTTFPIVKGSVYAAVPDADGGWFVGGFFTEVGKEKRRNLAHIKADGTVSSWTANTNGAVKALLLDGNTLYVGGSFTLVKGLDRKALVALDKTTSAPTSFDANISISGGGTAEVRALAKYSNLLYIGGSFSSMAFNARNGLAAYDVVAKTVKANPSGITGAHVNALKIDTTNAKLFVGGQFSQINGTNRTGLGALDVTNGSLSAWNPTLNSANVKDVSVTATGVYFAGDFTTVNATARPGLAALDPANSATLLSWNPNSGNTGTFYFYHADVIGADVYVSGYFSAMGTQAVSNLAIVDASTGALKSFKYMPSAGPGVVAVDGSKMLIGGDFSAFDATARKGFAAINLKDNTLLPLDLKLADPSGVTVNAFHVSARAIYLGGRFKTIDGAGRRNMGAVDAKTGSVLDWNPAPSVNGNVDPAVIQSMAVKDDRLYVGGYFDTLAGSARQGLAAFNLTNDALEAWTQPLAMTSSTPNANALTVAGDTVYVGGYFDSIGGQKRGYAAALDVDTAEVKPFNPQVDKDVRSVAYDDGKILLSGIYHLVNNGVDERPGFAVFDAAGGTLNTYSFPAYDSGKLPLVGIKKILGNGRFIVQIQCEDYNVCPGKLVEINVNDASYSVIDEGGGYVLPSLYDDEQYRVWLYETST